MIDFLTGAFSVLKMRGDKIIRHLEEKDGLPPTAKAHCARIADKTRLNINSVNRRLSVLQSLTRGIESGRVSLAQSEPILPVLFQSYRDSRRELDAFEEFFAGHINRFIDADKFLTHVTEEVWKEARLPGDPPVAVTNTSGYFCTVASLGIVFCPPSTEDHLLSLPDFYHESGHILPEHLGRSLYGLRFQQALHDHETYLRNQIRRISLPLDAKVISDIIARWDLRWAEEVACDALAAQLTGPAYGWCNLHLCLQSPNLYAISPGHPADAARTTHIFRALKRLGWAEEVNRMESHWEHYLRTVKQKKPRNYDVYHPADLFTAITEDVTESSRNLSSYSSRSGVISTLLNDAWRMFLSDPTGYVSWERQTVTQLRRRLMTR
jgi:hypothetical protein